MTHRAADSGSVGTVRRAATSAPAPAPAPAPAADGAAETASITGAAATAGRYRCDRCTLGFRIAPRPEAGSGFREVETLRCTRCGCRFWSAVPGPGRAAGAGRAAVVVGVWPSPEEPAMGRRARQGSGR